MLPVPMDRLLSFLCGHFSFQNIFLIQMFKNVSTAYSQENMDYTATLL